MPGQATSDQDCYTPAMPGSERLRDYMAVPPTPEYFAAKSSEGYQLVAIEWRRSGVPAQTPAEDVPFGLRISSDCRRLEPDPEETEMLMLMLEVIVKDGPLSEIARVVNERGFRTRDGNKWTLPALFNLLPRLIELGPRLCSNDEWAERRKRLFRVA
jgi:hypothetical protein